MRTRNELSFKFDSIRIFFVAVGIVVDVILSAKSMENNKK